MVYEIDTAGLSEEEKKDLSKRMIAVLRKRIDPTNIRNLIWRPQGNTRFEIQIPPASAKVRAKRMEFEKARDELLAKNINRSKVMRLLDLPAEERSEHFMDFAQADPNRKTILENLAKVYDERKELHNKRDELDVNTKNTEEQITSAGLDLDQIKFQRSNWAKLDEQDLQAAIKAFLDSNDNQDLLTGYVKTFNEWSKIVNQLTDPEIHAEYRNAISAIDRLNLSEDQLNICLEKDTMSLERKALIDMLKTDFPDRVEEIEKIVAAFDEYRPFRGRLDDPKDLQRMLKGAGILEFRILPTQGHPDVDMDQMASYVERLKGKGPKTASDNNYIWCEIENIDEWNAFDSEQRPSIVTQFGDKYYVLASNKLNDTLLHNPTGKQWKLEKANPTSDNMGRRAIGFLLDEKGGILFSNVTGMNIDRPLCILLDGIALSAPCINDRIRRQGVITGSFTQIQVEDMVNKLNAGSLPAKLIEEPISITKIE